MTVSTIAGGPQRHDEFMRARNERGDLTSHSERSDASGEPENDRQLAVKEGMSNEVATASALGAETPELPGEAGPRQRAQGHIIRNDAQSWAQSDTKTHHGPAESPANAISAFTHEVSA